MTGKIHKKFLRKMEITFYINTRFELQDELVIGIHTFDVSDGFDRRKELSREEVMRKYITRFETKLIGKNCSPEQFCKDLMSVLSVKLGENIHPYGDKYTLDSELKSIKFFTDGSINGEKQLALMRCFSAKNIELKYKQNDYGNPWILKVSN